MAKWTFTDTVVPISYTFEINPVDGGIPVFKKNVSTQNTLAPGGKVLLFEGQDQPQTVTWTGTLLTQTQYEAFVTWFQKRHQILVTDDRGVQMWVYITDFAPKRERAIHHQYKMSYTITAIVLDVP